MKELNIIQVELNAPKNQTNKFGGYKYRSCEDILEALKPLLKKTGCTLTISDDIVLVGEYYFIKATATLKNSAGETESTTAYAELDHHKGMSNEQSTGSSSSYCRKYCLAGLFCLDDNKDADATNTHGKETATQAPVQTTAAPDLKTALKLVESATTLQALTKVWNDNKAVYGAKDSEFSKAVAAKNKALKPM